MQTFVIIGLFLEDISFEMASVLFNLRFSLLMFDMKSIFANVLRDKFIESSRGNFWWLITDPNILRNLDELFILTVLLPIIYILGYLLYQLLISKYIINNTAIQLKKKFYRLLELLFKVVMYPAIVFSFNTFISFGHKIHFH